MTPTQRKKRKAEIAASIRKTRKARLYDAAEHLTSLVFPEDRIVGKFSFPENLGKEKSDMRKEPPQVVYANMINLVGLYAPVPVKCRLHACAEDGTLPVWWDKRGDFDVQRLGIDRRGDVTCFASPDRHEVEIWMEGVKAVFRILKQMATSVDPI